jgi:hypothetical protein
VAASWALRYAPKTPGKPRRRPLAKLIEQRPKHGQSAWRAMAGQRSRRQPSDNASTVALGGSRSNAALGSRSEIQTRLVRPTQVSLAFDQTLRRQLIQFVLDALSRPHAQLFLEQPSRDSILFTYWDNLEYGLRNGHRGRILNRTSRRGGWFQVIGDRIALSPAGVSRTSVCCFSPRISIQP